MAIVGFLTHDSPLTDRLYLSSTSSTLVVDDEKILVLKRLKTYDSGVELTKEILSEENTAPKAGTLENLLMWARNWKYDIGNVRTKKGWNYPSCGGEKCKKGNLDRKEGRFWCDSCNSSVEYHVIRYRLELEIPDDTTEVVVVMFDKTATSLLKCSASSILDSEEQDEEDHSGLPPSFANIVGTSHTLELKSHTYYEHGTYESSPAGRLLQTRMWKKVPVLAWLLQTMPLRPFVLKRLNKTSSVATPSKLGEEKKHRRSLKILTQKDPLLQTVNQNEETWHVLLTRGKGKGLFWMTRNEQPKFGHLGSTIIGTIRISTPVESYVVRKKK